MHVLRTLSAAGFAATAISYGPARMGFGLFAPEFRDEFGLSSATIGFISSAGFAGFLASLLVAQLQGARWGPAVPVMTGLAAATAGMAIIAAAPDIRWLTLGVCLSATSAGFAWTPFNDAVHRTVRRYDRPAALSVISTGTSIGIVMAGLVAAVLLPTGLSWRFGWAGFSLAGALVLIINRADLRPIGRRTDGGPERDWRCVLRWRAAPLFATALVFGTGSAIYIAFAADRVRAAGGIAGLPAEMAPSWLFVAYGLFGLAGLATGRVRRRLGLVWTLRGLLSAAALSAVLVALVPDSGSGVTASAGLQGLHVMMMSAVLAFWSEQMFPARPSLGFTAALLAASAGSVCGTALAGLVADAWGSSAMFLGAAVLPVMAACGLRARHVRDGPVGDDG